MVPKGYRKAPARQSGGKRLKHHALIFRQRARNFPATSRATFHSEGIANATRSNYLGGRKIAGAEAKHRGADYANPGNGRAREAGKYSRRISGRAQDRLRRRWSDRSGSEPSSVEIQPIRARTLLNHAHLICLVDDDCGRVQRLLFRSLRRPLRRYGES
jgi:hypothetical protein